MRIGAIRAAAFLSLLLPAASAAGDDEGSTAGPRYTRNEIVEQMAELASLGTTDPDVGWTHVKAGMLDLFTGDVDAAIDSFETATRIDSESPTAARAELGLGISMLMKGDEKAASESFRNAAEYGHGGMVAYAELSYGRLMMNQGNYREAEDSFARVVEEYSHLGIADDAALGLAKSLQKQGRYRDAADVLEDARAFEDNEDYQGAGSDKRLRWDHLDSQSPDKVASFMQRSVFKAMLTGKSPIVAVLTAMTDTDSTREIRRTRREVRKDLLGQGTGGGQVEPVHGWVREGDGAVVVAAVETALEPGRVGAGLERPNHQSDEGGSLGAVGSSGRSEAYLIVVAVAFALGLTCFTIFRLRRPAAKGSSLS